MSDRAGVEAFYGRWARLYDVVSVHTPGLDTLRRAAVESMALEPGDTVVDLGCGTGANFPFLRERVGLDGTVIGIDRTPGVLERAERRVRRAGWRNVDTVRGDAERPPIERVDALLASFLVGMLEDPASAVDRWCSIVRGGRVTLLDARSNPSGWAWPVNAVFRAFVAVTAPPTSRVRYRESPARVLDRRVEAAHDALAAAGSVERDSSVGLGFIRLTSAHIADR